MKKAGAIILISAAIALAALCGPADAQIKGTFLYDLSNFTGTVPYGWVRINVDPRHKEIYVVSGDSISIYNENGMEVFSFGTYDLDFGAIYDIVVNEEGDLLALSYKEGSFAVNISNFRGEPKGRLELRGIPPEYAINPNRMVFRNGKLYFAALNALKVFVTDSKGNFTEGYDLAPIIGVKDDERSENDIFGFNVDGSGNMIFTVPTHSKAYVVAPDGNMRAFGRRGSAPGRFGIPSGIVADSRGNLLVSDTLRCVVMIFNKDLQYVTEFGYRGFGPGNLIGPRDMVIDEKDRLYVTQLRKRGVSVFRIGEE